MNSCAMAGITLVGAGLVVVTPAAPAPSEIQARAVQLTSGGAGYVVDSPNDLVGLVVGGSGTPIPPQSYIGPANDLYIQRILPGAESHGVFTPEGLSPIYTGVKSLPLDTSVAQGATMLDTYVKDNVDAGNTVAVFGESQSSTISGFVMTDLEKAGVPADAVKFVLVGDPSNPDGGMLERFNFPVNGVSPSIPSLQITFSGATPPDTIYDTSIYTQEYDGFADFPKYPLNILADLNAFLGIQLVHPTYRDLTPQQLDDAIKLDTTIDYHGVTDYYMIPHAGLPLAEAISAIPVVGKPLADLLEPDLRLLVNLGYDNPDPHDGWDDTGAANVPTQFGVFPSTDQVVAALQAMGPATQQGADAFMADLAHPAALFADPASGGGADPASLTDIVNALTGAFSQAYSILLPTADILTAVAVTLPTYEASIFFDKLDTPLNALGLALAANTGLLTLAGGVEFMVIEQTLQSIQGELSGVF